MWPTVEAILRFVHLEVNVENAKTPKCPRGNYLKPQTAKRAYSRLGGHNRASKGPKNGHFWCTGVQKTDLSCF
jgi:hypothetical protein